MNSKIGSSTIPSALGTTITGALANIPFRFGIDSQGNYGYKKAGADTVTPFSSGGATFLYNKGTQLVPFISSTDVYGDGRDRVYVDYNSDNIYCYVYCVYPVHGVSAHGYAITYTQNVVDVTNVDYIFIKYKSAPTFPEGYTCQWLFGLSSSKPSQNLTYRALANNSLVPQLLDVSNVTGSYHIAAGVYVESPWNSSGLGTVTIEQIGLLTL